ncbi:MAG: DNA repair protein RecN [Bacteroidales bacterium]|jgi:DNA repair protein RecN (Recombination protein N)|nr:DNA repair protein RecN [Bacteroidales bacterium]MCI2122041.1 DNA repair protein RecN [Bacteroidales bacterium]MCI2145338.1 DNA repair protein RecN [Bacteroidales bacterium]
MLRRLTIRNYALIETLDVSFPEHLVIITGETGAGKTILLGALSLLLGAKSDASVLSDKTENCVVEGEFETGDERYLIRRVVSPQGRSRSFVNDEPVTAEKLKELSSLLIDIHAQNSQALLADSEFQLSVVDSFAGDADLCSRYGELMKEWKGKEAELHGIESAVAKAKLEKEFNAEQFRVLDGAALKEGEQETLEGEQKRLSNVEEILAGLESVLGKFSDGDEYSMVQNIRDAEQTCRKTAEWIPRLSGIADRLESCRLELKDMEEEIGVMASNVNVSPERLQVVEDRLSQIYTLERRFGAASEVELMKMRDRYASAVSGADELESDRSKVEERCSELERQCFSVAGTLHESRVKAARAMSSELEGAIRELQMPYAVFRACVGKKDKLDLHGMDDVKFLFSANGKTSEGELAKCASGGEMSRIMLCIKAMLARYRNMPTMIFDEIDTGVSGSIADKMGDVIVKMGKSMQVVAITHLPQMAAKGDAHFVVSKRYDRVRGRAVTEIRRVEGKDRVTEIAKMLSGAHLSEAAMENARVLLEGASAEN